MNVEDPNSDNNSENSDSAPVQAQPHPQVQAQAHPQPLSPVQVEAPPKWESLGLAPATLEWVYKAGYLTPTPIQVASIPLALQGHDLIASAQTGTGKTASFVLPMVDRLAGKQGTLGLILSPTREIAQQTQECLEALGHPLGVKSIVLIGGIDMKIDERAIATYPQVIVATPGRLCDHLERGNIWLDFIQWVVLDEADRMLDMGFSDQLARIMKDIPENRQTLVFSATIPQSVQKLAQKVLNNPQKVAIGKAMSAAKTVDQRILWMKEESKGYVLRKLMEQEKGSIIVFVRSKDAASRLWRSLHSRSVNDATVIHSDRRQSDREQALADFKEGKYRVLIATDVAGRGIHVDDVAHVINYDLPREPEDYIHRIGRTGRIGNTGKATSFATERDRPLVAEIEKIVGTRIPADSVESAPSRSSHSERGQGAHSDRPSRGRNRDRQGSSSGPSRGGNVSSVGGRQASAPAPRPSPSGTIQRGPIKPKQ